MLRLRSRIAAPSTSIATRDEHRDDPHERPARHRVVRRPRRRRSSPRTRRRAPGGRGPTPPGSRQTSRRTRAAPRPPRSVAAPKGEPDQSWNCGPSNRSMVVNSSTGLRVSCLGNLSGTPRATAAARPISGGMPSTSRAASSWRARNEVRTPPRPFVAGGEQEVLRERVDRAAPDDALALEPPVQDREARQVGADDEQRGHLVELVDERERAAASPARLRDRCRTGWAARRARARTGPPRLDERDVLAPAEHARGRGRDAAAPRP